MSKLQKRVVDISYNQNLGHLSSTLSAVDIIDDIYYKMSKDDLFILSSGHAALAWYVVLEKYKNLDAEMLFEKHGVHPHRNVDDGIEVSTGSLGMGITVAVGHALADPNRTVWCLISDGECGEGSVWEALRFIHERDIKNIKIVVNVNGMIAYDFIDVEYLQKRLKAFLPDIQIKNSVPPSLPNAEGILTHYYVLKPEDYKEICETYSEN